MEKIIFLSLAIPILVFLLYLGVSATLKGLDAKEANRAKKEVSKEETNLNLKSESISLSEELEKLDNLQKKRLITQEEFEKAKKKLLNN